MIMIHLVSSLIAQSLSETNLTTIDDKGVRMMPSSILFGVKRDDILVKVQKEEVHFNNKADFHET